MDNNTRWFQTLRTTKPYQLLREKPLAYFSIEFALSDTLPTYAGGLGVLAGDFIKELLDQQIPAVAVGLYYQSRYGFDAQQDTESVPHPVMTPSEQLLVPVLGEDKKPLVIKVPIGERDVLVKAWLWQNNTIPLYLLDTNVSENDPADRTIGYKLYDDNKEIRLKQEMVLGIGGFRLLQSLRIEPSIYHMNEGHSALLELEIIHHEMKKRRIGFSDALKLSSHHVVFTNHTLVPAGNDMFSTELLHVMLNRYASEMEVPVTQVIEPGIIQDTHDFSMSVFAMRLAGKINGVSKLHVKEASKVWPDYTLEPITNGIHISTWQSTLPHIENKEKLLQFIAEQTGVTWEKDALLIGWARRFVRYKRPLALFEDLQRFVQIAKSSGKPVNVIMAGLAHQSDDSGREMLTKLQNMIGNELKGSVVYLPNYNTTVAKMLTTGCDVWLNTPVVGSEACGTSGMKATLNGTLPCSTKDGWMDEVNLPEVGWSVDSETITDSLLTTLEQQIVPAYYREDKSMWENLQKNGRALIINQFSATRMLRDYFEKTYLPIITTSYEHYEF